jgi:hypothetical protein
MNLKFTLLEIDKRIFMINRKAFFVKGNILTISLIFGLICILSLLISYMTNDILFSSKAMYNYFGDRLDADRIDSLISRSKSLNKYIYILLPLIMFIKVSIITLFIYASLYYFDFKTDLAKCFTVSLLCEVVPLIEKLLIVLILLFSDQQPQATIERLADYSIAGVFDKATITPYVYSFLQNFNLTQAIYIGALVYFSAEVHNRSFRTIFRPILASYIPLFLIYSLFASFIIFSVNPSYG